MPSQPKKPGLKGYSQLPRNQAIPKLPIVRNVSKPMNFEKDLLALSPLPRFKLGSSSGPVCVVESRDSDSEALAVEEC
jgi:hypothetical protein